MLSMPPATITSALPASSKSWASMAAFMPEPHILFDRRTLDAERQAGAQSRLAGRSLPLPGRQHAAHDGFLDRLGGQARALQRGLDGGGAEFGGGDILEIALQAGHRRAGGTDDDDRIGGRHRTTPCLSGWARE